MRLYVDTATNRLVEGPGQKSPVVVLEGKLRDTPAVEVVFLAGLVAVELDAAATGVLGLKALNDFAGDYVASDLGWIKTGAGETTVYTFTPDMGTAELLALFAPGTVSVDLSFELEWQEPGKVASTVRPVTWRMYQDVNQGAEGPVTQAPGNYRGAWRPDLTGWVGGAATDLDAVVTVGESLGTLVLMESGGVIGAWRLAAAPGDTDLPHVVRPVDWDAGTNDVGWVSKSEQVSPGLSLTLLMYGTGNVVEAYTLDEWTAFGVINPTWKPASSGLEGLHIGEGVTEIGSTAFAANSALIGVVNFPASLRTLGSSAFFVCGAVQGFGLNQGLETIGGSAFEGCPSVVGDLVIPDSVTSIGASAFESWTASGTLTLGSGLLTIGASAFAGTAFTGDLVIPPSVTAIADNAFDGATGFGDLILNEGLLTIGAEAFADVNATNEITIPSTVTSIGAAAFENGTFTSANCYVTSTIVEGSSAIFLNSALSTLHVRASDSTWTAGVQVVGANPGVNVIKDL